MRALVLSAAQWEAVRQALDQFVSGEEDALASDDDYMSRHGAPAGEVLDRMNAEIAALADVAAQMDQEVR